MGRVKKQTARPTKRMVKDKVEESTVESKVETKVETVVVEQPIVKEKPKTVVERVDVKRTKPDEPPTPGILPPHLKEVPCTFDGLKRYKEAGVLAGWDPTKGIAIIHKTFEG